MILSEQLMDQAELLELANDAIILTDAHGDITYWNRGACRTYGWEKKDALGQNVDVLLRTEFSDDLTDQIDTSLKQKSHWEGELIISTRTDERFASPVAGPSRTAIPPHRDYRSTPSALSNNNPKTLREREEPPHQRHGRFHGNLSIRADGRIPSAIRPSRTFSDSIRSKKRTTGNFFELLRTGKMASNCSRWCGSTESWSDMNSR